MVRSQFPLLLCQAQSSSRRQRVPLPHPQDGDWWLVNGDLGTSLIPLSSPKGLIHTIQSQSFSEEMGKVMDCDCFLSFVNTALMTGR